MQQALQHQLLLVPLDRALPPRDGLDLCRLLRTQDETAVLPILMIAAQDDETDTIVGLEVGADDYVIWPVSWKVLRARIRALVCRSRYLQRTRPASETQQSEYLHKEHDHLLNSGDLHIDLAGCTVLQRNQPIQLSARLFDLLVYFVHSRGIVLSRKYLMAQVYQESEGDVHLIDVYVHWLREKLEDDPTHPQLIQTVRSVGYRFRGT